MKLIAENLIVARGGKTVIEGLSFAVGRGEALLLTGPNGAGKTTLLRATAGILPLTGGTITLEGGDPEREIPEDCHYVGHLNGIKANLTVAENLAFWGTFLGSGKDRVAAALGHLELEALAEIPTAYLSAGQKRRVGLARLLVTERPIWLLDEPTASLDRSSAGLLSSLVESHCAGGGLALIATHLPLGLDGSRELRLGMKSSATPGNQHSAGAP